MKRYALAISFLIIAATIYFSFYSLMPQKVSDVSTPITEFSTERALAQLKEISKNPHFVGSKEHKNVRGYIASELEKLGLQTVIQEEILVEKKWREGTTVQNILAKIKGTDSSKALLLLSHYDSDPHSAIGASDAGSGVVTILEGIRAYLASGKQPKNDIIILISDGEELGLLGAHAFVRKHPWAKDVGLVLNFEARGSGGPSYMLMETNGGNKNLIQEFQKGNSKYPVATSLMYSIYKMLPNDTDLTVFREKGDIDGFNFAFIDDHFDYHTAQDNHERLDKNTLEHQGTYLIPLLNYFADADLSNLKSQEDYVYFNFPFIGMVYYPFSWIIPSLILVLLLFLGLLFYGLSQGKLNGKEIFKGFIPLLLSLIVSGVLAKYGWQFLKIIHPQYNDIQHGFTYNGHLYIAAFSALTLAICFICYKKYFKKYQSYNLLIASIVLWITINIAVALYLKGAAYFITAALFGVICLALFLFSKASEKSKLLWATILSIPILIMFVPMVQMFPIGLGLKILMVSATFIVLLFGLLVPVFSNYQKIKLGRLFLLLSIILFITASFQSSYTVDRKKPNSINYVLDADTNEAYWASYNNSVDDYTKQFLGENPVKGGYDSNTASSKYNRGVKLHKKAEIKPVLQPIITIDKDTIANDLRFIDFSIKPQRKANRIELIANSNFILKVLSVNNFKLENKKDKDFVYNTKNYNKILSYYLTPKDSILNIQLSIPKEDTPKITLYEVGYDLLDNPNFEIAPRSEIMMPMPFVINDAIIIKKQIEFDKKISDN